jgi:hypothetical protein
VTVTVDNGSDTADVLGQIRTGLNGFVETLSADVEFTLISTTPQPRTVVTGGRAQPAGGDRQVGSQGH